MNRGFNRTISLLIDIVITLEPPMNKLKNKKRPFFE